MNGKGQPYQDGKFLVQDSSGSGKTPVAAPDTISNVLIEDTGTAVFLKYRKHNKIAFASIALFR